jgi:exopolyphosphatase/guanosine-5'-triphosphate,3'-diphosphate pyrophosphatase
MPSAQPPELLALLDLGSNAARFLLARVSPGVGFRILEEERVQTRLGAGPPGVLPRAAVDQTLRAVHRFLARVPGPVRPRVLAVATSAVRDAVNREHLLGPLRRDEGIEVRILSGQEEARLGAVAALHSLSVSHGVVADLGGGSLQLSRVRDRRIVSSTSLPLGVVRSSQRYLRHDPPTAKELRGFRETIATQLFPALPPGRRGEELVGLGGSVRTLARMHLTAKGHPDRSRHGLRLRQSDVTALRERLEALSIAERRRIAGLKDERADIILAGAMVIETTLLLGGYLTLVVCTHGVRDGLLLRETFNGDL